MDSIELNETLLDPATRQVLQLEVKDFKETDKIFTDLYGKVVEPRIKFLQEHGEEARADYE